MRLRRQKLSMIQITLLLSMLTNSALSFTPSSSTKTQRASLISLKVASTNPPTTVTTASVYDRSKEEKDLLSNPQHRLASIKQSFMTGSSKDTSDMNVGLIRKLCLAQITLLAIATAAAVTIGGTQWFTQAQELYEPSGTLSLSNSPLVVPLIGTVPLVGLHTMVASQTKRAATLVDFATNDLVISLFGRRRSSNHNNSQTTAPVSSSTGVLQQSLLLTGCNSLAEEVIYRFFIPLALLTVLHDLTLTMAVSSLVYGLAHTSPNEAPPGENIVVGLHQTLNGAWYSLINMLCGGLWPSMLIHALYDMHVLNKSWHQVNDQMDWVEQSHPLSPNLVQELRQYPLSRESLVFLRRFFYAFDSRHAGRLTLDDVQRAITYSFASSSTLPTTERVQSVVRNTVVDENHITLPDFVQIVLTLRG